MKVLLCPDKFKGSLSAQEVCTAIGSGLKKKHPEYIIIDHPMADGGDGSLQVLTNHLNLSAQAIQTTDPLGRRIDATYFTSSQAAFIEVASASGLVLLSPQERNPLITTTLGTGKMMAEAIAQGYEHIYLFLGGSATNDAGIGIAGALGCRFLDGKNKILEPTGENLLKIQSIKKTTLFDFTKIRMTLLCDVTNPLYGPTGAAHVYARQKGATEEQIRYLDQALRHFSQILQDQMGITLGQLPGGGAAGGIGAGLAALFGAVLQSGFDTIATLTDLEQRIQSVDLIISGEGRLDDQSLQGKVVSGVARLCKKHGKPLVLFVGKNDLEERDLQDLGASRVFSIAEKSQNLEDAMLNGASYLRDMAEGFADPLA